MGQPPSMPPGWWILPGIPLGLLTWWGLLEFVMWIF